MVFDNHNELCLAIICSTIILGLHMLVSVMHRAIAHPAEAPVLSSSMALQTAAVCAHAACTGSSAPLTHLAWATLTF